MSEPFIAEVRIFAGNFAPRGWAFCNGQLLPIAQNTALFSLIGTIYGGDGRTTTALPDLRERASMQWGRGPGLTNRRIGERGGQDTVTLTPGQVPPHSHAVRGVTGEGGRASPDGARLAAVPRFATGATGNELQELASEALGPAGGNQAHNNRQPVLGINFIIALQGLYPSRS